MWQPIPINSTWRRRSDEGSLAHCWRFWPPVSYLIRASYRATEHGRQVPKAFDDSCARAMSRLSIYAANLRAMGRTTDASNTPYDPIEYAAELAEGFQLHAQHEPAFAPEHAAAIRILELMRRSPTVPSSVEEIRRVVHTVETAEHYDGTGWFVFRSAVDRWLLGSGYSQLPEKRIRLGGKKPQR